MAALPLLSTSSAIHSIHDVFHSTAFAIGRGVAISLALVFWLALAFWVFKDARRRIADPFLVGVATLLGLVPYLGAVVYLLFRPAETLGEVRARTAELRALEQQLARARPTCPVCSSAVQPDFLACPVCTTRLRQACAGCGIALEPLWQACPYCAAAVEPSQIDLDAALTAEVRMLASDGSAGEVLLRPEPSVAET